MLENIKYIVYDKDGKPIALFFDADVALKYVYSVEGAYLEPVMKECREWIKLTFQKVKNAVRHLCLKEES